MSNKKTPDKLKFKIPYIFFIFFGIIFAVNIFYIHVSKKTWRGLITEDSYYKGLHYNQVIAEAKKQKELKWQLKIIYKNSKNKSGDLEIFLLDKSGKAISDAKVEVYFKRPTQDGQDFMQEIKFFKNSYKAKINFPLIGQWDFLVSANRNSDSFQESKRFIIQ